jgi:hypothetical protein
VFGVWAMKNPDPGRVAIGNFNRRRTRPRYHTPPIGLERKMFLAGGWVQQWHLFFVPDVNAQPKPWPIHVSAAAAMRNILLRQPSVGKIHAASEPIFAEPSG